MIWILTTALIVFWFIWENNDIKSLNNRIDGLHERIDTLRNMLMQRIENDYKKLSKNK